MAGGRIGEGGGVCERSKDPDFVIVDGLESAVAFVADQFEDGEEDAHDPRLNFFPDEERTEGHTFFREQSVADLFLKHGHRSFIHPDGDGLLHIRDANDASQSADEVPEFDFADAIFAVITAGDGAMARESRVTFEPFFAALFKLCGSIAVTAILHQAGDEVGVVVGGIRLVVRLDRLVLGQDFLAFDFEECGSDDSEVAGKVKVGVGKGAEEAVEVGSDAGHGNLADVDFVTADEVQQEIERTSEPGSFDAVLSKRHSGF